MSERREPSCQSGRARGGSAGRVLPRPGRRLFLGLAVLAVVTATPVGAEPDRFPEIRPATRVQAIRVLSRGAGLPSRCLTPVLLGQHLDASRVAEPMRRALAVLEGETGLRSERRWLMPDGTVVRYTLSPTVFDRAAPVDADGDGILDILEEALQGISDARALIEERLDLPGGGPVEIMLADVGRSIDGYTIPGGGTDDLPLIVVDASPAGGAAEERRLAAHQYAHAAAAALFPSLPPEWGEAWATWVTARLERSPDTGTLDLMSARARRLSEGLLSNDLELAAGNALWLAFLEEAYGLMAVRTAMQELGSGEPPAEALSRALRRVSGDDLRAAFREFHLWTILSGARDDGRHFSFGDRLAFPGFAATADGTPVLSVRADPPVLPLGGAGILIRPEPAEGGMKLLFEGDVGGSWDVDVLLRRNGASLHRVPIPLGSAGRGEVTVPLHQLDEVVLLVRNGPDGEPEGGRYTWSAHREKGFPFELDFLEATAAADSSGVLVTWQTLSESRLLGFNVMRRRVESGETVRVNPVWVPSVGDAAATVAYQFLDASAEPGVAYAYWIEGVTVEGLTTPSTPVPITLLRASR